MLRWIVTCAAGLVGRLRGIGTAREVVASSFGFFDFSGSNGLTL